MSLCPLIYNNKQGINSANHLVSIMNIQGNQLYSSLSQLTRQSFLMQTELPTLLNVFETDYSRPSDRVRLKNANCVKFSGQIMRLERPIVR